LVLDGAVLYIDYLGLIRDFVGLFLDGFLSICFALQSFNFGSFFFGRSLGVSLSQRCSIVGLFFDCVNNDLLFSRVNLELLLDLFLDVCADSLGIFNFLLFLSRGTLLSITFLESLDLLSDGSFNIFSDFLLMQFTVLLLLDGHELGSKFCFSLEDRSDFFFNQWSIFAQFAGQDLEEVIGEPLDQLLLGLESSRLSVLCLLNSELLFFGSLR
jgi:hypothetical protein